MSRIKNYEDEKQRLDAMSVDEALFKGHPEVKPVTKPIKRRQITIKRREQVAPRGDLFAFDDRNGVFQVKTDYEMTDADWRYFYRD